MFFKRNIIAVVVVLFAFFITRGVFKIPSDFIYRNKVAHENVQEILQNQPG